MSQLVKIKVLDSPRDKILEFVNDHVDCYDGSRTTVSATTPAATTICPMYIM